jgi:hypothetical protein
VKRTSALSFNSRAKNYHHHPVGAGKQPHLSHAHTHTQHNANTNKPQGENPKTEIKILKELFFFLFSGDTLLCIPAKM